MIKELTIWEILSLCILGIVFGAFLYVFIKSCWNDGLDNGVDAVKNPKQNQIDKWN
jgi:hypothetical protein